MPHSPSLRSLCPHLRLLRLRPRLYLCLMTMAIRTLWAMHTLLDMDMPIRIRMAGTPLWRLNLPLRVLMQLESVIYLWISAEWIYVRLDLEGGFVPLGAVMLQ